MNYNKDRIEKAYDIVGLYADSAWTIDNQNGYFHANQELWRRKYLMKQNCERTGGPRSVVDTIPNSKLATYGSYIYNDARENMYMLDLPYEPRKVTRSPSAERWRTDQECWMTPYVEKLFNLLTDTNAKSSELEQRCIKIFEDDVTSKIRYESYFSFSTTEYPDNYYQSSAFGSDFHQDSTYYTRRRQCTEPPCDATNFHELVLQIRLHSNEVRSAWSDKPGLNLSTMNQTPPNTNNNGYTSAEDPTKNYDVVLAPDLESWTESYAPIRQEYLQGLYKIAELGKQYEKAEGPTIPLPSYSPPHWIKEFPVLHSQSPNFSSLGNRESGKRLYSAVLQNVMTHDCELFDDLERQALEQYRPSMESLERSSSEDLERQALEQYSSGSGENCTVADIDSSNSSIPPVNEPGNGPSSPYESRCGGQPTPYAALMFTDFVQTGYYQSHWTPRVSTFVIRRVCYFR